MLKLIGSNPCFLVNTHLLAKQMVTLPVLRSRVTYTKVLLVQLSVQAPHFRVPNTLVNRLGVITRLMC